MEISIGDYGRMMFEMMTATDDYPPDHWLSIKLDAEPLVRRLIALNTEMEVDGKKGGYKIVGYKEGDKKKLSEYERIVLAQKKMLTVKAKSLKEGDRIWYSDGDIEMHIGEQDPAPVIDVTKKAVYVEMDGCNYEYIVQVGKEEDVLKAPEDWHAHSEKYGSAEYWLEQADRLGI